MWPIRKKKTLMLKLYLVVMMIMISVVRVVIFRADDNSGEVYLLSISRHPDKSLSVRKGPLYLYQDNDDPDHAGDQDDDPDHADDVGEGVY